jgi:PRTRC genetic system protein C
MYTIENMQRKFLVTIRGKEIDLPDLGYDKTPEEVIKMYSDTYPELLNSAIQGPEIDSKTNVATYSTKPSMGSKG